MNDGGVLNYTWDWILWCGSLSGGVETPKQTNPGRNTTERKGNGHERNDEDDERDDTNNIIDNTNNTDNYDDDDDDKNNDDND